MEPSRGGMGIRLNVISTMFISAYCKKNSCEMLTALIVSNLTASDVMCVMQSGGILQRRCNIPMPIRDWSKFDAGPAIDVIQNACRGLRVLERFIGTGFAHPNIMLDFVSANIKGNKIVPIISTCRMGFNDNRFAFFAVSSPHHNATSPCDTSCIIMAIINATRDDIVEILSNVIDVKRLSYFFSRDKIVPKFSPMYSKFFSVSAIASLRGQGVLKMLNVA